MRFTKAVKKATKPLIDVPSWIGYHQLADTTKSLFGSFKSLFTIQKATRKETFAQAMKRLGLTEADLTQRKKEFTRLTLIFLFIALAIYIYTGYLISQGSIHASIAGFCIGSLSVIMAFRYHFWLFQMKQRKLGCTLKEWLDSGFIGKG